jgi:hypothetical protein
MAKHNQTGRSKSDPKHVRLYEHIERSEAWRNLSGTAVKAWLAIGLMHNGSNNGKIGVSSRELGDRIGASHVTAAKAILELVNAGFLRRTKSSSFGLKRLAAEYRLTHLRDDITGAPASKEFARTASNTNAA